MGANRTSVGVRLPKFKVTDVGEKERPRDNKIPMPFGWGEDCEEPEAQFFEYRRKVKVMGVAFTQKVYVWFYDDDPERNKAEAFCNIRFSELASRVSAKKRAPVGANKLINEAIDATRQTHKALNGNGHPEVDTLILLFEQEDSGVVHTITNGEMSYGT